MSNAAQAQAEAAAHKTDPNVIRAYKKMLLVQFLSTVGMIVILFVSLLSSYYFEQSPLLLPLLMEAGIIGALFSALLRLYDVDQAGVAIITPTLNSLGGAYVTMYALVPPLVGAIAAVLLYVIFISKLIDSPMFPTIGCQSGKDCASDILHLMKYYWPAQPQDYGKAIVWSFVAGFSERLVPDLLQSVVDKQTKKTPG